MAKKGKEWRSGVRVDTVKGKSAVWRDPDRTDEEQVAEMAEDGLRMLSERILSMFPTHRALIVEALEREITALTKRRVKWGVAWPDASKISSGWTYDRAEAEEIAGQVGIVVDFEEFYGAFGVMQFFEAITGVIENGRQDTRAA
jgi:uncharacterized protein (DUF608 family)